MRALLIGLGRWGEQHLRVLRGLGADIWVADVSSDRLAWAVQQGVDAARAVADYRVAIGRDYLGRGMDDLSFTAVEYGPTPVVVEAGYFVPGTHRECVIVGERGSLVADFGQSTVTAYAGEHHRRGDGWEAAEHGSEELKVSGDEPLRRQLGAFLECVARRTPTPVDATAGVRALEVVEAAARSSRLGRRVTLDEVRSS